MKGGFSQAHLRIIDELIQYHAAKLHALSARREHLTSPRATGPAESLDNRILAQEIIAMWKCRDEVRKRFRTIAEFADYIDQMLAGTQPWNPALLPPGDASSHANTKRSRS